MRWDKVNKWLYLGKKVTIMFDNWHWISKQPTLRHWCLFEILYDNGAWWGDLWFDPDTVTENISIPHMNGKYIENDEFEKRTGTLPCFIQITIIGIGFRYSYDKKMSVVTKKMGGSE